MKKISLLFISLLVSFSSLAIEQDGEGYYLIGSVEDWDAFAAIVAESPTANAKMTADVNLGDDQTHIGSLYDGITPQYAGVFDGQGHTLTVAYVGESNQIMGVFTQIQNATIKNLHVDGSINSVFAWNGVVGRCYGRNNVISNVWNSADITVQFSGWNWTGGIVGGVSSGNYYAPDGLSITDCLFTASITSSDRNYTGCFIGAVYNTAASFVTVSNCLSTGTLTGGRFYGGTYSNCYVTQFPATIPDNMQCTAEQIADGTIATALQAERDEVVWVQDEKNGMPMLRIFAEQAPHDVELEVSGQKFKMIYVEGNEAIAPFYIGQCEVTEALWTSVLGVENPSYHKGNPADNLPVEGISWHDCQTFVTELAQVTGIAFRLPTSDEWTFAARGGNQTHGYTYSGSNSLDQVGWYGGDSGDSKHTVGTKAANELGIFDMSGNVYEYVQATDRIYGGGWHAPDYRCKVTYFYDWSANSVDDDTGMRLASTAIERYPVDYEVENVDGATGGKVSLDKIRAASCERVTVSITCPTNMTVKAFAVVPAASPAPMRKAAAGRLQTTHEGTVTNEDGSMTGRFSFLMPPSAVTVNVTFGEGIWTGVEEVQVVPRLKTGIRYNVMGQRVDENYRGIVIVDGDKILVK